MTPNDQLLRESAQALKAYAYFLRRFGVLDIKVEKPSPALQRLRDEVAKIDDLSRQLKELAA